MRNTVNRLVIKIGSSTLTDAKGKLDADYLSVLAAQVNQLRQQRSKVVIVSSAAIVAGLETLGMPPSRPSDIPTLQAMAAVGQLKLAQYYTEAFSKYDITLAQVLLTRHDTDNRDSYLHIRNTMERLIELGIVPLINENDTVAIDEIRFGDNDTLAAQVAILIKADLVILLSDIDGLYTADPRQDEDAKLLKQIGSFTAEVINAAGSAGTEKGSGGMITKLEAARILMAANIPMVICEGHESDVIVNVASGKPVGTRFSADKNGKRVRAKKLWMALSGTVKGSVLIDDGAVKAIVENGGSLLPVGVKIVNGSFAQGSLIDIRSKQDLLIGRGLSAYSSEDLKLAAGQRSETLASTGLMDGQTKLEVIHRDQMVVF